LPVAFDPSLALTSLLYSGEIFDQRIEMQYLRARYYNPANGTFNRLDPFFGRMQDPQSLHKYLYVHGDPGEWY
jgi:RHS repeat-associated protein